MLEIIKVNPIAAVFFQAFQREQVRTLLGHITPDEMSRLAQLFKSNTLLYRNNNLNPCCPGGFGNRSQAQ
ncbi:hypothetical protein D3C81_2202050 [compost metagenome]